MDSRRKIIFFAIVAVLLVVSLGFSFSILNPTPPRTIVMSTGPVGSSAELFAEQYRQQLALSGVELQLRSSEGALENLDRLSEPEGDVSVAFTTMGATTTADLYSLGSMFFEPLWVFYSDPVLQQGNLQLARGERFSIGPVGSRTNSASRELFQLFGLEAEDFEILTLSPNEAAEQLKAGAIAGATIVASASSPVIQDLLASPEIGLVSFLRADALAALYPPLTKLTVPAGVGDLAANVPPEDIQILAFTTILTARSDLHPAIQSLLLDAATQIHSVPDMFHADGSFPSPRTYNLPLSPTAARYYKSGRPFLQRYLPFWLAVLAVQLFAMALPLIGILYPAISVMPSVFDWAMRRRIYRLYGELRYLEMELAKDDAADDRSTHLEKLNDLDRRVRRLRMPITFAHLVYTLRTHINVVRSRFQES